MDKNQELPYFMTNKEWYCENPDPDAEIGYILTPVGKKIPAVVRSYREYYSDGEKELCP